MAAQLNREWTGIQQFPPATQTKLLELLGKLLQENVNTLTILVMGKGGVGKSSTVNSILGERAAAVSAFQSEVLRPMIYSRTRSGFTLNIIDTPGLVEGGYVNEHALEIIKRLVMKMEAKKSRMPPYGAAPWLVFSHGKRERTKTFFNVSEGNYYVRNIPEMRRSECLASCYGWLVMLNKTSDDLFLLNSVSLQKIQLPCLSESYSFNLCVLSSPPTDPDCVILCIVFSTDFFIYCHPGDDKWIKLKYRIPKKEASFRQLVSCNGKLYTYGFGKLGIIDVNADHPVTWLEELKEPEWPRLVVATRDTLVESCGDIFLVRWGVLPLVPRVPRVEVCKMDFDRMAWVKVDTLGDRVLFLGRDYSISCSASDSGLKRDCIYFMKPGDTNLYVFHLDRGTISAKVPCPNVRSPWFEPFWVMPAV